jgi:long-chain acyl-CoA synthetase
LADEGVGSQDRVAFLDKNGIEHFEVLFGVAMPLFHIADADFSR